MYYCCVLMKSCRKTVSWHSGRFSQKNSASKKAFGSFVNRGRKQSRLVLDTALGPGPGGVVFYMEKSGGIKIRRSARSTAAGQTVLRIGKGMGIDFALGQAGGEKERTAQKHTQPGAAKKVHCPVEECLSAVELEGVTAARRDRKCRRPVPGSGHTLHERL